MAIYDLGAIQVCGSIHGLWVQEQAGGGFITLGEQGEQFFYRQNVIMAVPWKQARWMIAKPCGGSRRQ